MSLRDDGEFGEGAHAGLSAIRVRMQDILAQNFSEGWKRVVRVCGVVAAIMLLVFGFVLLVASGVAAGSRYLQLVPSSIAGFGVTLGLALMALGVLFVVGVRHNSSTAMTVGTTLLAALIVVQFSLGGVAFSERLYVDGARALFHDAWRLASDDVRHGIELQFNCCGFDSAHDHYGDGWNSTCTATQSFYDCCAGLRPPLLSPVPVPFSCTQERFRCCYPQTDHCFEQAHCADVVVAWADAHLEQLGGCAIAFACFELVAFVLYLWTTCLLVNDEQRRLRTLAEAQFDEDFTAARNKPYRGDAEARDEF